MELIPPPETIVTSTARLFCDGDERDGGAAGDGHPRVWLQMDARGFVDCPYCDRRFVLAAGASSGDGH